MQLLLQCRFSLAVVKEVERARKKSVQGSILYLTFQNFHLFLSFYFNCLLRGQIRKQKTELFKSRKYFEINMSICLLFSQSRSENWEISKVSSTQPKSIHVCMLRKRKDTIFCQLKRSFKENVKLHTDSGSLILNWGWWWLVEYVVFIQNSSFPST